MDGLCGIVALKTKTQLDAGAVRSTATEALPSRLGGFGTHRDSAEAGDAGARSVDALPASETGRSSATSRGTLLRGPSETSLGSDRLVTESDHPVTLVAAPKTPRSPDLLASDHAQSPGLIVSPAWAARLNSSMQGRAGECAPTVVIPRAPGYYADAITLVQDRAGADALLDLARQRPISFVGFDFEYRHDRPGVLIKVVGGKERRWYDPRSIEPLLMAIAIVESRGDSQAVLYRFVIDVRRTEVLSPLADLLRRPVTFVTHFGRGDLFCLWKLGLPIPDYVWDTWVAERALQLGLFHARYKEAGCESDGVKTRLKTEAEEDGEFSRKLVATCSRRGVPYRFARDKDRLQKGFLTHPADAPFSLEQQEYAAADAEAQARLYPVQVQEALVRNALNHLQGVEQPWSITNSRMIWDGVRVDSELCGRLREACRRHVGELSGRLAAMGVGNPGSHRDLKAFFRSVGLLDAFRDGDSHSFDDDHLGAVEDRHHTIPLIRAYRKARRLESDKLLSGELVGADGRLHPDHRQLGAESGRNTMSNPNVGGVGRALRPLVVPEGPAWAIGEADLSQIEVLIAAACSGDTKLLDMVNGRDVYAAMARGYYASALSPTDIALPDRVFKKRFKRYRDRMKIFTLAIIYNITPFGLARQLGIDTQRAASERERFLAMFPVLDRAQRDASAYGAIRGFAEVCTGLRRNRARGGQPTGWENNWLRNTPIQGSAAVVFKVAGNRLRQRYEHYDARLILPLHDAFVFECPRASLQVVAKITGEAMRSTVQEYFPVLDPQVDINIDHPACWNKDGKHRSLELWMRDPELARQYLMSDTG
jgi:DNA polymerase-1